MAEAADKPETMDVDKSEEKENGTTDGPVAPPSAAPEATASPTGEAVPVDAKPSAPEALAAPAAATPEAAAPSKSAEAKELEKPAPPPDPATMPVRQYLETSVVKVLQDGMQMLVKEGPEDPIEALANYMLENNPKRQKKADA